MQKEVAAGILISIALHTLVIIPWVPKGLYLKPQIRLDISKPSIAIQLKNNLEKKISGAKVKKNGPQEKVSSMQTAALVRTDSVIKGVIVPKYPYLSRVYSEEGKVAIEVLVNTAGVAERAKVISSSGHLRLDKAALVAVKKASFIPAKIGEKKIETTKELFFNFSLRDFQ